MLKWSRNQQPCSASASQERVFNPDCLDKAIFNEKSTADKLKRRSSTTEVDHSCVRSQLELLQPDANTERCSTVERRGSLRRWLVGSLRRVGKSRGGETATGGGVTCGLSRGGWGSLRRSKSADRCGPVGGGLQPPGSDATKPTQRSLLSLPEFAETAGVICQMLGNDPADAPSLRSLVDAALNSPIADSFRQTLEQLRRLQLSNDTFAVVSVVGQALLEAGQQRRAAACLECALRAGSCGQTRAGDRRMRGSVLSSLGRAHWLLGNWERAVECMEQDLDLTEGAGDQPGQWRALGNLSSALCALGRHTDALNCERRRLRLANSSQAAAESLACLSRLYATVGDHRAAEASQRESVRLRLASRKSGVVNAEGDGFPPRFNAASSRRIASSELLSAEAHPPQPSRAGSPQLVIPGCEEAVIASFSQSCIVSSSRSVNSSDLTTFKRSRSRQASFDSGVASRDCNHHSNHRVPSNEHPCSIIPDNIGVPMGFENSVSTAEQQPSPPCNQDQATVIGLGVLSNEVSATTPSILASGLCRRRRCQPPAAVESMLSWDSSSGYGSARDFPASP